MIKFKYAFKLPESGEKPFTYTIDIDEDEITLIDNDPTGPEWTKLENYKCQNCPLKVEENEFCPVAKNLFNTVEYFKNAPSFEKAEVYVETPERTYYKNTSLQDGLFSIFGVIMATSGCPPLDFLRPMARFHLPFSTLEETMIRSSSMKKLKK
ncbi:MAG: hypothetical protein HOE90_00025 [Bacteriovoracaceae bacterium]|jgi:hypothetical protein|nr:hypothetical protein [Bacteriovoracaceae bacterium]